MTSSRSNSQHFMQSTKLARLQKMSQPCVFYNMPALDNRRPTTGPALKRPASALTPFHNGNGVQHSMALDAKRHAEGQTELPHAVGSRALLGLPTMGQLSRASHRVQRQYSGYNGAFTTWCQRHLRETTREALDQSLADFLDVLLHDGVPAS